MPVGFRLLFRDMSSIAISNSEFASWFKRKGPGCDEKDFTRSPNLEGESLLSVLLDAGGLA